MVVLRCEESIDVQPLYLVSAELDVFDELQMVGYGKSFGFEKRWIQLKNTNLLKKPNKNMILDTIDSAAMDYEGFSGSLIADYNNCIVGIANMQNVEKGKANSLLGISVKNRKKFFENNNIPVYDRAALLNAHCKATKAKAFQNGIDQNVYLKNKQLENDTNSRNIEENTNPLLNMSNVYSEDYNWNIKYTRIEAMYPEKMTTEQLAEALDEIAEAFDPYEYRDNVERGENTVQEVMLDLRSGNIHSYISYLKDIVDEECDLSVRAGVLIERLKAYEPELPKDMEPMVYVNYCEESDLMNPRCQKLSELDAKTAEMDKEWYAKRDPKTEEPTKIAKIYVTVYYAEKGEQMLHHFKKSMDIGNGHGGIVSQLKYDNEMKLTDEYWINYQKGKGSEEFQKYMEDLTDMQNHVLPYLQSFCNLEEKGVKERREQQIAERYEGRADERVTSTEANEVVKDVGKTDRKPAQQKQAVDGKDKKLSIHERLEINKRIIQEKQGKDKTERGVDLGVRTV